MNQHKQAQLHSLTPGYTDAGAAEQKQTAAQLAQAVGTSQDVLVRVQSVFPFKIFPTTLSMDRAKITITERDFFKVGEILSIRIEDVLNVTAHVGPLLGSVRISTRFFNPEKPYVVDKLARRDALKFKRIVQGYLIARQEGVDCTKLSTEELARMLDEMGKVSREERV